MKTPILLTVMGIFWLISSCQKSDIQDQQSSLQSSSSANGNASIKKKGLSIGDYYGGGIIFYIDPSGEHGRIASTKDLGTAPWGCSGILMPGTSWDAGTGSQNTDIILGYCQEPGIAARICHDLVTRETHSFKNNAKDTKEVGKKYNDWYLPSMDEMGGLLAVSYSLNDPVLNNLFPTGSYWTSCQGPLFWHSASPLDPSQTAFAKFHYDKIDFSGGQYIIPEPFGRGALLKVRAIRSF
jgi:hypothetical protein